MTRLRILGALAVLGLLLLPVGAASYDILLDIDIDDDPTTINIETEEETALVSLVLWPDLPGELITVIDFGLGGTCWDCIEIGGLHTYGTDWDLPIGEGWLGENPLFESSDWDGLTCINCCGNPGYHHVFIATAAGGGFELDAPIFLREFTARYADGWEFEDCPHPPADLMTFPGVWYGPAGNGNTIYLDGCIPVNEGHWSELKALY